MHFDFSLSIVMSLEKQNKRFEHDIFPLLIKLVHFGRTGKYWRKIKIV